MAAERTEFDAVLFDYAGVITKGYVEANYISELSERFGVDTADLQLCMRTHDLFAKMSLGVMSEEEVIDRVCSDLPGAVRLDRCDIRTRYYDPDPEVVDAIDDFRARSTAKLAIVSNIFPESVEYLRGLGVDTHFDETFFSCEVGDRKPNPTFYLHVSNVLGVDPANCLFFDDATNNVEGAQQVGMTAIQVDTSKVVEETLARLE